MKTHPANKRIPESAIIRRPDPPGSNVSEKPKVEGDKSLIVMDVAQKAPVQVFLLKGRALNPGADHRIIFVQGQVSNGIMPAEVAKSKFAVMKDGTLVYNARGFDDVAGADFDMLDIAELIENG
jgi:hypothetical protein